MTCGKSKLDLALQKARECVQGYKAPPYYNDKGFIAHPPPVQQGQEVISPHHNPNDEPTKAEWFMDSEQHEL